MADTTPLEQARAQYPQLLQGLDDATAIDVIHKRFYPENTLEEVQKAAGYTPPAPPTPGLIQQAKTGFGRSFSEVPGLAANVGAFLADAAGAKETGAMLAKYAKDRDAKYAQENPQAAGTFSDVLDGKAGLASWLADSAGYVTGQALQALMTGGVGSLAGRGVALGAARAAGEVAAAKAIATGATEAVARKAATDAILGRAANVGAVAGMGAQNVNMELGSIYSDALDQAQKDGRQLDGGDRFRVLASALTAAGVDTLADSVMAGKVIRGSKAEGGLLTRAAKEVPAGVAREAATEGVQTAIEQYGAGKPLDWRDIVDSAAVGAVGGGLGGAGASLHRRSEAGVETQAALTESPQIAAERVRVAQAIQNIGSADTVDGAIAAFNATKMPLDLPGRTERLAEPAEAAASLIATVDPKAAVTMLAAAPEGTVETSPTVNVNNSVPPSEQSLTQQLEQEIAAPSPGAPPPVNVNSAPAAATPLGQFASAEDASAYVTNQRRNASIQLPRALPLQLDDGSFSVANEGQPEFAQAQQQALQRAGVQPGDLLTKDGQPYGTKSGATLRVRRDGGTVVAVEGGWVVRPAQETAGIDTRPADVSTVAAQPMQVGEPQAVEQPTDEPKTQGSIPSARSTEPTSPPPEGTTRYYHGGAPGDAAGPLWFTSDLNDARGWAARDQGMSPSYVDVPNDSAVRGGDASYGVLPPQRIEMPPEVASQRQPFVEARGNAATTGERDVPVQESPVGRGEGRASAREAGIDRNADDRGDARQQGSRGEPDQYGRDDAPAGSASRQERPGPEEGRDGVNARSEASRRGDEVKRSGRDENLVALRKRASVLESLRTCLAS